MLTEVAETWRRSMWSRLGQSCTDTKRIACRSPSHHRVLLVEDEGDVLGHTETNGKHQHVLKNLAITGA